MNAPFKALADLPVWDLTDLYAGREDAKIEADLAAARAGVERLSAMQGTLIAARADAAALGQRLAEAIDLYQTISDQLGGLGAYAFLAASTRRDDPAANGFEADIRQKITLIAGETLWLTLEINDLEAAEIDAALAALRVGKEGLTLAEALNRLSDPKGARRKAAAEGLNVALAERSNALALVLNTVAQEKALEDRWRGFKRPADSRHLMNEVDGEAVDAMAEAVAAAYPRLSHRYYALKARVLGKPRLDQWDRNAPLSAAAPRQFDWAEGRALVLDSFADLGGEFADRARGFFDQPWIHARPLTGKQPGAYAHPVTANRHPYVFLNWMGERRDVLTLAHELGHGVHQTLAAPQGSLLADTPLTLAETASIFAEGLTFDRLLDGAAKKDQQGLLAARIEDGLNTVVRQIAFHRFETRFHDERAEGDVPASRIGEIWLEEMGASLGPSVTLSPGYEHWWSYVSHFVHSPFYVYAYAFGDLLVAALMEKRRADPAGFTPLYRDLLAGGGARTYVEALAPFDLNPRDPAFWSLGVKRLERLIDRFEALVG